MNAKHFNFLSRSRLRSRIVFTLKTGLWAASLTTLMAMPAIGQGISRNWTGANSANWSDPNNWSPAGIPSTDDYLTFGAVGDANPSMVNDLTNLQVLGLDFVVNNYQIDGNALQTRGINASSLELGDPPQYNNVSFNVTVNCPIIFGDEGGVINADSPDGIFSQSTINLYVNGPIILQGTNAIQVDVQAQAVEGNPMGGGNSHVYISGQVSGSGGLSAEAYSAADGNSSTIQFDGTPGNTFTGPLMIYTDPGAQIIFDKSSGFVVTNGVYMEPGGASLQCSGVNQIGSQAVITLSGGGLLSLSGNNNTVGGLIFTNYSSDALAATLDTGSTTLGLNGGIQSAANNLSQHPTIKGKINMNGLVPIAVGGSHNPALEIQATVEGVGFDMTGPSVLLLDGNNTFTGNLQIDGGTVVPTNAAALSPSSAGVVLNGGSLQIQNLAIGSEPLFADSTNGTLIAYDSCSWAGPVTVNGTLKVLPSDFTESGLTMNFSGPISGTGSVTLEDDPFVAGNVEFSGSSANTFSGPLLVQCQTLFLDKPFDVQAFAGPLTAGGGPSLICEVEWDNSFQCPDTTLTLYANGVINLNNFNETFDQVTFNGGTVESGTGQFGILQPLTVNTADTTAYINGNLGLISAGPAILNVPGGFTISGIDLQVNAAVIGSAPQLVIQGGGTVSLAGPNTSAASTLLKEGTLAMDNPTALGIKPVVISSGATLKMDVVATLNQSFELAGDGVPLLKAAIDVAPNVSETLNGPMLLDAETTFYYGVI
jgi:autotransporter-associated beta strand protein